MADDDDTPAPETDAPAKVTASTRLPADHPLVKAFEANKQKLREREDADKTELERLQGDIAEKDKTIAELPATVRRQALAFASQAVAAGFADPEDALVFLGSDVDLADSGAVKTALADLAERKPHLLTTEGPKRKLSTKPKPKDGKPAGGDDEGEKPTGKAAAVAALQALAKQKK